MNIYIPPNFHKITERALFQFTNNGLVSEQWL